MKIVNISVAVFLFPLIVLGWSTSTHQLLSQYACVNSRLVKDIFITKFNLDMGFVHPLTVSGETKTVAGWILDGEEKEDAGTPPLRDRSGRHFHNPLKVFGEAGLIRWVPLKQQLQSSILWAQDEAEQNKFTEGDMSWKRTRDLYYEALIWPEESMRHALFGLMFKGLGHQMHLVQDMSNPEHTRNDNHPWVTIESWAEDHNNDIIDGFCQIPLFPNVDLETLVHDSSTRKTLSPIARLTDADVYLPENPVPSATMQQGLSEYSNANFVSDDTIFLTDFPHPGLSNIDISKIFVKTNTEYKPDEKGAYLPKINDGDPITHFLRLPYLKKYTDEIVMKWSSLDELCYKDIASMLIPRAVGYSAALINYFFRGEIEITLSGSDSIYSLCTDQTKGFDKITIMVKNITPGNEEMNNGKVSLIVSYRMGNGSPFIPNPSIPDIGRCFIKSDYYSENPLMIPAANPMRIDFDLSDNPLPVNAVDVTLTIVFKGDLGAELTDAVAIGFKDISEPTPIDLFNNTDKVCFSGNYVNYDDASLWDVVDVNPKNGEIDCLNNAEVNITRRRIKPLYLSFNGSPASSSNYYYQYESGLEILPRETPHRIFVLADAYPAQFNFSILVHAQSMENPDECFSAYLNDVDLLDAYTNKLEWISSTEPGGGYFEHYHSTIGYFRGYPYWS